MENEVKKKDDEKLSMILVGGVFGLALIAVDIFYADWWQAITIVKLAAIVLHAVIVFLWLYVFATFNDPNKEWYRKALVYLTICVLIAVCLHKALNTETKQVQIDADKNKQEQNDN